MPENFLSYTVDYWCNY